MKIQCFVDDAPKTLKNLCFYGNGKNLKSGNNLLSHPNLSVLFLTVYERFYVKNFSQYAT